LQTPGPLKETRSGRWEAGRPFGQIEATRALCKVGNFLQLRLTSLRGLVNCGEFSPSAAAHSANFRKWLARNYKRRSMVGVLTGRIEIAQR
jgi:hypothetical protein